ncbi:MAG TPA: hypothetical protein VF329_11305 [Gammaproteobacteria bacterium]
MPHAASGLDADRLAHLEATIHADIEADRYFGAVVAVARRGELGLCEAIGFGDEALEMTFVCLSAGVMQPAPNIERFQRLSDIAASAAL